MFSIIIAISLETIQYIIPWRAFNVNDMMGNVVWIGVGIPLVVFTKPE